jgi:hypothetical protein
MMTSHQWMLLLFVFSMKTPRLIVSSGGTVSQVAKQHDGTWEVGGCCEPHRSVRVGAVPRSSGCQRERRDVGPYPLGDPRAANHICQSRRGW